MALLILLNNFFHDFSAAGWLFATIVMGVLLRRDFGDGDGKKVAVHTLATLLLLTRISIVGIIVFGLVRAFAYRTYEWNAQAGQGQVTLLMVKHVIFTIIFVVGMTFYIKASRFVGRARDEEGK